MWLGQTDPAGMSKLREEVAKMPGLPTSWITQHAPVAAWYVSYDQLTEEEKTKDLVYGWFCMLCRHHPELENCSITVSFWDNPKRHWQREIFTVGWTRTSGSTHDIQVCVFCCCCFLKEKWPDMKLFTDSQIGWLELRDYKVGEKDIWGKKYMDRTQQMGKGCEDTCVPCKCSPKGDQQR